MKKRWVLTAQLKRQIIKYVNNITMGEGVKKVKKRWIKEMIFGIQATKDIKLSNIARSIQEDIPLIKTEGRLSRQTNDVDATRFINEQLLKQGKYYIKDETVLAIDISDIKKRYGEKMEYLARVRDGSEGDIVNGYNIISVMGAEVDSENLIPMYGALYSSRSEDFVSENVEILNGVEALRKEIGTKGIWCMDRGGDRKKLYNWLLYHKLQFVIRLNFKRDLVNRKGKKKSVKKLAYVCECPYEVKIKIHEEGKFERERILNIGSINDLKLPGTDYKLTMLVINGFGAEPLALLTDIEMKKKEEIIRGLEIYLTRWKCEESFRFIKQSYQLEDIRVRSYIGLRNIVVFVHAVFYFISVVLAQKIKLNILLKKIFEKSKRFFEIPPFKHYAICDGIYNILFGTYFQGDFKEEDENKFQVLLPIDVEFT